MGRDFQKQQEKISQYIFNDYIYNRDFSNTDKVLKSTNLLIENEKNAAIFYDLINNTDLYQNELYAAQRLSKIAFNSIPLIC